VDEIVRSCGGIAEYQVEISNTAALPELSVQIEPRPDCSDLAAVLHKLERAFESAFALRVPITTVPVGHCRDSSSRQRDGRGKETSKETMPLFFGVRHSAFEVHWSFVRLS
jgi:hypothetical protein